MSDMTKTTADERHDDKNDRPQLTPPTREEWKARTWYGRAKLLGHSFLVVIELLLIIVMFGTPWAIWKVLHLAWTIPQRVTPDTYREAHQ